jgi:hypothetical protein
MKKTVLTFGLIAGVILSVMMAVTVPFHDTIGYDRAEVIGYTSMILAFLLIFFGVRSYRDSVARGTVSFGRAFAVGALIAMVASVCYTATWEVIYFNFESDFLEKYQAHQIEQARANGESEASIAAERVKMERNAALYHNPAINAAITFLEPLPVGLLVALVSAAVLRRKRDIPAGQGRVVVV